MPRCGRQSRTSMPPRFASGWRTRSAPDLAAWQYWDAVPDYLALLKSGVRQQYPARLAMLVYLQKSPNAKALGFSPAAAPADGKAERWNPWLPQP